MKRPIILLFYSYMIYLDAMSYYYDALKYNRPNFTPELLFRPPTSVTHGELEYLAKSVASSLEGNGASPKSRVLRMGSEWEMIFFNPEMDPIVAEKRFPDISGRYNWRFERNPMNPNYNDMHMGNMKKIGVMYDEMARKRSDLFDWGYYGGKGHLFFEFRTQPLSLDKYLLATKKFRDALTRQTKELGVLPVVYSQHIHMSLQTKSSTLLVSDDEYAKERRLGTYQSIIPKDEVLNQPFKLTYPLMLMPEEWEHHRVIKGYQQKEGKRYRSQDDTLPHVEFRALSSEYAHDPLLNLVISLRSLEAGCKGDCHDIELEFDDDYCSAVAQMTMLPELREFFGISTLNRLTSIVSQYPDVSTRKITLSQVRT